MRLIPSTGKLTVRFNGFYSETTKDVFTNRIDFEGYRIYSALDDRPSSFSVISSYDRENFSRVVWREESGRAQWVRDEVPYTIQELRQIYDILEFDPLLYTRDNPVDYGGEIAYFEKQDFNQSDLNGPYGIRKVYPDAVNPGVDPSNWQDEELVFDYGEPLPKYYEYEYVLDNLLPTVPYYVAVTTFDYGSPRSGLKSLESKPENSFIAEFPMPSSSEVEQHNLAIFTVPNPYRIDGEYLERGFENRVRNITDPERSRRIHFYNLPGVCTISIYSLDGDLIRQIDHNYSEGGPESTHDYWDLITRNMQSAVAGLYYWVVDSPEETQIGTQVIIK